MNRFVSTLSLLFFLLLPLLAGCGPEKGDAPLPTAAVEKSTPVTVRTVTAQNLVEYLTLPGTLVAWEDLTLAAEIAGPVDWVGPQEGAPVSAGQKLMTIDSASQQANLERNQVDADVKQKAMDRLARLVAEQLVSQQEYESSVSAFEAARQNLKLARIGLQKSIVTAPIAGVLDARLVERGEYIKGGDPVALLVQVDRLKVLIDVPEKDVRYLHQGEQVNVIQVQIDNGRELRRSGTLVHMAYKADPQTRTYRAKVEVDNSDHKLRPGMIVKVEALRRQMPEAIAVPLYAVVDLDGRKVVFIEEEGKALLRPVQIEHVSGDQAVILEGVQLGDRLVVKGQQLLADGAAVKVEAD